MQMVQILAEAWTSIRSGPYAKHKEWLVLQSERDGKTLAVRGPTRIALELEFIAGEDVLLEDAAFKKALASGEDFFGREPYVGTTKYVATYEEGKADSLRQALAWEAEAKARSRQP